MVARVQATDVSCQEHMNKSSKASYQIKIPTGFLITFLAGGLAASTLVHARNDGVVQKILADQEAEIRFVQRWLKRQQAPPVVTKPTDRANPAKANLL
jgi:hypothetical protein